MNYDSFYLLGGVVEIASIRIAYEPLGPLEGGKRHVVWGQNGVGKSTLVRCTAGVIPHVHHGKVSLNLTIGTQQLLNSGRNLGFGPVGVLPQDVQEYLLGLPVNEEWNTAVKSMTPGRQDAVEMIRVACGIDAFGERSSLELSDGEKQRVAIACALASNGSWLMLDEWQSHLDDHWLSRIDRLLDQLVEDHRLSTVEFAAMDGNLDTSATILQTRVQRMGAFSERLELVERMRTLDEVLEQWMEQASILESPSVPIPTRLRLPRAKIQLPAVSVPGGTIGVISGPNGSGKTTLLKSIARSFPRGGVHPVLVLSNPTLQLLGRTLGSVVESYTSVPAGEALEYARQIANALDICSGLDLLDLNFGAKKLLALMVATMAANGVLLLDEPFDGLDHVSRILAIRLLRYALIRRRLAVVITSPSKSGTEEFNGIPIVPIDLHGAKP